MNSTTKPQIMTYALKVYEEEGRTIFTAPEISQKLDMTPENVRADLRKFKFSGYLRSYQYPILRCGGMVCKLHNTIWALTRKGADYAADRKLDFEPASGQFLLKSEDKRGVPSSSFILELD